MEESRARGEAHPRSPLRVVMVIQRFRPYFSGQAVQLEELSRALVRRGVDVTIVTAARGPDVKPLEFVDGYRVRRLRSDVFAGVSLPRRLRPPAFAARAAAELARSERGIDLVHVHGVHDALYTAWAFGRLRRVPVLLELTLTGADDPIHVRKSRNLLSGLRYTIYRRMDGYVAISPQLADALRALRPPPERLRTIPQGVDLSRYRPCPDRGRVRRELGLPAAAPVFAFVGSLVERKGIDLLLGAWTRIAERQPQARLILLGRDRFAEDRAAEQFLGRELARLSSNAANRLLRYGVRDDPERFLSAADAFLFPSRQEGFGTAIVEAMACGLPCIVAEMPGISDFIFAAAASGRDLEAVHGADGIVVAQGDATALADAALALVDAPGRARAIGAAARKRAERCFGIDTVAEQYVSFYRELTAVVTGGAPAS